MSPPFASVLIANRGEIAVRIARTLRRMGIRSVLACHPVDASSPAARAVDDVAMLEGGDPLASYLDGKQIVERALQSGAQAVHPGYGFLAENAAFAASVTSAGLSFIGPPADAIALMGDKVASRAFAAAQGCSISASAVEDDAPDAFADRALALGLPLLIKASAGGGGKGMQIVRDAAQLRPAIERARSEATRFFADGRLYAERYLDRPRHIEVQVLADAHGRCIHLYERECSIQRRFQKLIEETPAPNLSPALREALCREAVIIASAAGYRGAGTVEFILAPDGSYSFLEMNTRLQVEHPVTELVTGIDLVEQQVRIAAGEPLPFPREGVTSRGHALECRICAEVPEQGFVPATGMVRLLREPTGEGIRFDAGIAEGSVVRPIFDPMLAKLIAHGSDREQAIARLQRALGELVLLGVACNADYLARVVGHPAFRAGELHTAFLSDHELALAPLDDEAGARAAVAAAALSHPCFLDAARAVPPLHRAIGRWRN
jgi:propionyl-CoA carboxylase alpha chain/3-methylcrotonyl-CoA carboxylase alpha subunit/acetyl-CoA/propionyl-CoA carboxylase biotin carboxyl carrier protein